jgi:hypothetical protein
MNLLKPFIERLAAEGIKLFPVRPDEKLPAAYEDWKKLATDNLESLDTNFMLTNQGHSTFNLGVRCGATSEPGKYLFVVDVDVAKGKRGLTTLFELELSGYEFPETFTVETPTKGLHFYYFTSTPFSSGTNSLGEAIDHRGEGGFVVGPGSKIFGSPYWVKTDAPIARLPHWIEESMQRRNLVNKTILSREELEEAAKDVDYGVKFELAKKFLESVEPAIEGQGGNAHTFKVFARLKDFGLTLQDSVVLADKYWNQTCQPPWSLVELTEIARNAYKYGAQPTDSAYESLNAFAEIKPSYSGDSALERMVADFNKRFAVLTNYRNVLRVGEFSVDGEMVNDFGMQDFSTLFGNSQVFVVNDHGSSRFVAAPEVWVKNPNRRTVTTFFDMDPSKIEFTEESSRYNMFRGFTFKPCSYDEASSEAREALLTIQEHIFENVCGANTEINNLFWAWLSQTVSTPKKKLITVPCLISDQRGTGKSVISNMMARLLDPYSATVTAGALVASFNSVFSNKKFVAIEEMYRTDSKSFNSIIRDIASSPTILIKEKYKVERIDQNLINLMITSNYLDCVEAHTTERRFAILEVKPTWVGQKKKWDRLIPFLDRYNLDNGLLGGELLADKWLSYDTSKLLSLVDNTYNRTVSLDPVRSFLFEAVSSGLVVDCVARSVTNDGKYQYILNTTTMHEYFLRESHHNRNTHIKTFNRILTAVLAPGSEPTRRRINGVRINCVILPEYITRELNSSRDYRSTLKNYFISNYRRDTNLNPDVYEDEDNEVLDDVQTH